MIQHYYIKVSLFFLNIENSMFKNKLNNLDWFNTVKSSLQTIVKEIQKSRFINWEKLFLILSLIYTIIFITFWVLYLAKSCLICIGKVLNSQCIFVGENKKSKLFCYAFCFIILHIFSHEYAKLISKFNNFYWEYLAHIKFIFISS